MRVALLRLAAVASAVAAVAAVSVPPVRPALAAAVAPDPTPGVYQVWGRRDDVASRPYVKGGQVTVQWKDVEPSPGRFTWAALDRELAAYAAMGKPATVQVNADPKPAWLWDQIAYCGTTENQEIPQYWDPRYLELQERLVTALAAHLKASPHLSTVALVRANPNAIGTELTDVPDPGACRPATNGRIVTTPWDRVVARHYYKAVMGAYYRALVPEVNVALRTQLFTMSPPTPPLEWLGVDGAWIMGTASDIDTAPIRDAFDVFALNWVRPGSTHAYWEPHHTRGKRHLASWNYWRLLLELHKGVSYIAVYGQEIRNGGNPEYEAAFLFANRYAGRHLDAAGSPGAWVALKRGPGRTAGNLHRFMTQVDPDMTSVALDSGDGAAIIGSEQQRYGRYARRVDGGTVQGQMAFQLDPAFRAGVRGVPTTLRVVYLDQGVGRFRVRWGTRSFQQRTVTKAGSNEWRELQIRVSGSAYRAALPSSSDVTLTALGTERTSFHMVEVAVPGR